MADRKTKRLSGCEYRKIKQKKTENLKQIEGSLNKYVIRSTHTNEGKYFIYF